MGKNTILSQWVWRHDMLTFHFAGVSECGEKVIWPCVTPIRHFYWIKCLMPNRKCIFLYSLVPFKRMMSILTKWEISTMKWNGHLIKKDLLPPSVYFSLYYLERTRFKDILDSTIYLNSFAILHTYKRFHHQVLDTYLK